jgi:hypothetical protein
MVKTRRAKIYEEVDVFHEKGKLYYLDVDDGQYKGGYDGNAMITHYKDEDGKIKARIAFIPSGTKYSHLSPTIFDFSEIQGGLNAYLHEAMAVTVKEEDPRAVVFGKAASVTYATRVRGKLLAQRTFWSIKFGPRRTANNFVIVVKYLAIQADKAANNEEANGESEEEVEEEVEDTEDEVEEEVEDTEDESKSQTKNEVTKEVTKEEATADEAAEEAEEESSDDEWVAQSQQVCYKYDKY